MSLSVAKIADLERWLPTGVESLEYQKRGWDMALVMYSAGFKDNVPGIICLNNTSILVWSCIPSGCYPLCLVVI